MQSLTNLALVLESEFEICVITGAKDLFSNEPYKGIIINGWNKVAIPGSKGVMNVYYNVASLNKKTYREIFKELNPSVVYFNNIYSFLFFRLPLQALKSLEQQPKVVVCPRGMLQKGALAVKPLKKKLYLAYLRYSGALNSACWHATNQEEAHDIKRHFPKNRGIVIAANIPRPPYSQVSFADKKPGHLKLVYLSLVTEKKNLLLLLQIIKVSENVILDIYGPVTDKSYWQKCEVLIEQMPGRVHYRGDVKPADVQKVIPQYHALALLTRGENFGHALYESLSVGRPVITSNFTPWINLQQRKAGWNIDISSVDAGISLLQYLCDMPSDAFNKYCAGAHQMAIAYYAHLDSGYDYRKLFA